MDKDLDNYYAKARAFGDKVNFDLAPLIHNFSIYEFFRNAELEDSGAFLAITNKQYVIGYNAGFGEGAHAYTFARVMRELKGGGSIGSSREAFNLNAELAEKYIQARIIVEVSEDESHKKKKEGYIVFVLATGNGNKYFTPEQYEQFLKFYEEYNGEIDYLTRNYNFTVDYMCFEDNERIMHHLSKSLEQVKNYISAHIQKASLLDDEVILNQQLAK